MTRRYPLSNRGHGGGWVIPFTFSADQRSTLVSAWGGASAQQARQEAAQEYLDKIQFDIARWKTVDHKKNPISGVDFKEQIAQYHSALKSLQGAYQNLSNDCFMGINAFTDEVLFLNETPPEIKRLQRALADAVGSPNNRYVGLNDADYFIKDLLSAMLEGAQRTLDNIEVKRGKTPKGERALVYALADTYEKHFAKKPSSSRGSNFVTFLSMLAPMLGIEIGKDKIESVLNDKYGENHRVNQKNT